jgi:hypothetical protein
LDLWAFLPYSCLPQHICLECPLFTFLLFQVLFLRAQCLYDTRTNHAEQLLPHTPCVLSQTSPPILCTQFAVLSPLCYLSQSS